MWYKVNNLMYAAGADLAGTIRLAITLTEPVDAGALENALRTAARRYPYFAVKLVRCGDEYRMLPNDRPFVVSPRGQTVTLGSEQSNGHLFAFACEGRRLYVDMSHFATDGQGSFPFVKTLLYYYLSEKHPGAVFDTKSIPLAGGDVPAAEADDDPWPKEPLPEEPLGRITRPQAVFRPDDLSGGRDSMDEWTSFVFRIPQKELMAFASSRDGSPATFIASLMYLSVTGCCPDNRLPVVCGMQHQFRKALGKPFSHLCHVNVVPIVYPDSARGFDIEKLNTMARGRLIIGADDCNDALTVNEHIRNDALIAGMPLSRRREHMRQAVLRGIGENTFDVSYTGQVPWSGLDRYVTAVAPCFDLKLSGGLSIEIFSVGGVFCVNIMQRCGTSRYVDGFARLLTENGVAYEADPPERFRVCGFSLPE